ncbi:hypothetical protein T4A_3320 [Trichinella pseudospiralis]|uniref:Uncharacterized protein n=1 Tax=Trichinella pseudospiralis TaxID=6337 RepID=A0A0V1DM08_TRIPS|nr:hypothetical protein T4A_12039 [Trichinella pseudospiralis]KRY62333.1 hypothetical protein T4A_3320 [Trichinella pseudospiralis]
MAFYMDSKEKCNVHGDDFKSRLLTIFTQSRFNGILHGFKREM